MSQKYTFLEYWNYRHSDLAKFIVYTEAFAKAGQRAQKKVETGVQNQLKIEENDEAKNSD